MSDLKSLSEYIRCVNFLEIVAEMLSLFHTFHLALLLRHMTTPPVRTQAQTYIQIPIRGRKRQRETAANHIFSLFIPTCTCLPGGYAHTYESDLPECE